jgi:DNA (cytosine-5)-methyltransferase 1
MCGGGGSTTGIWRFFERELIAIKRFVAINHDKDAIQVHTWNHPRVTHFCQDFESVNLHDAFPEGYCDFAWASTSCTQHSRARGGRPINDQLREGPWHLLHFMTEIHVARMAIENVPEFIDWAPIGTDGRPLKSKRGATFQAWKAACEAIGYKFEWRIDNAADYGGGTTRERFIGLLTRRGRIHWAIPTHARDGAGDLFHGHKERWRGAREFLDFTIPSKPIVGRRVPLAAPTLGRAWYGIQTFWGQSAARVFSPDIRDAAYTGLAYVRTELAKAQDAPKRRRCKDGSFSKQQKKITPKVRARIQKRIARLQKGAERYEQLIADVNTFLVAPAATDGSALRPFLVNLRGTADGAVARSASSTEHPMPGLSAGGSHVALTEAEISPLVGANRSNNVPKPDDRPMAGPTTAGNGGLFLVMPAATPLVLGQHGGGIARSDGQPMNSIATSGAHSAVIPIVTPYYGDKDGKARASRTVADPLGTQGTENRFALLQGLAEQPLFPIEAFVVPPSSESPPKELGDPLGSPTTTQRGPQLVEPCLVTTNHVGEDGVATRFQDIDQPLPPRTQRNGDGVVEPYLVAHFGEREGQAPRVHDPASPFPSVTPRGAGDLIQAALERVDQLDPALRERLLIGQDGRVYVAHLHFRMLHPRKELAPAMGFPRTYRWPDSNVIVTKLVGNAVHVDWAEAIVSAFLKDWIPKDRDRDDEAAA